MSVATPTSRPEVAFVTGATSGIGRVTARVLAARGAAVGVVGRNVAAAQTLVREIELAGGRALALPADVSKSDEVARSVAMLVEAYGGLDTVVSCAGIALTGAVHDTLDDDFQRVMAVNVAGTWYTARHTVPHLLARGGGSFIAVSSDAGTQGACGFAAYVASKHAVNGIVKSMALDYGPKKLRCNAVSPGFVETPMADKIFDGMSEEEIDYYRRSVPLGRFATPEDVANVIAFLSSPQGAYANGMTFALDGGATAGYFSAPPT